MASFGWAYVDCSSSAGLRIPGPANSVLFLTGANCPSGSSKLVYYTGSEGGGHTASSLVLSGNMIVTGTLSASVINYEIISIIDAFGSAPFSSTVMAKSFLFALQAVDNACSFEPLYLSIQRSKNSLSFFEMA